MFSEHFEAAVWRSVPEEVGKTAGERIGIQFAGFLFEIQKAWGAQDGNIAGDHGFIEITGLRVDNFKVALDFRVRYRATIGSSHERTEELFGVAFGIGLRGVDVAEHAAHSDAGGGVGNGAGDFHPTISNAGHAFFGGVRTAGEAGAGAEQAGSVGENHFAGEEIDVEVVRRGIGVYVE